MKSKFIQLITLLTILNRINTYPSNIDFSKLKYYGFEHIDKTYNKQDYHDFIFTKINPKVNSDTTGSYDSNTDISKLKIIQPLSYNKIYQDLFHGQDESANVKQREHKDYYIHYMVQHLEKYEYYYQQNYFFDFPKLPDYSPQFEGYMWNVKQRGSAYDLLAKIYLYVALLLIILSLKARSYFQDYHQDLNPRTLKNRFSDMLLYEEIQNPDYISYQKKRPDVFQILGILQTVGALISLLIFSSNLPEYCDKTSKKLVEITTKMVQTIKDSMVSVITLNNKKLAMPRDMHGGQPLSLSNELSNSRSNALTYVNKAVNFKKDVLDYFTFISLRGICVPFAFILAAIVASVIASRKRIRYINQICSIVLVFVGFVALVRTAEVVSSLYLMQNICKVMEGSLGLNQNPQKNVVEYIEKALIQQGLSQYMHCYTFEFQREVRRQISSINSVQKSLIKSIKADVKKVKKRSDYKHDLKIPKDYDQVMKLMLQFENDRDIFFYPYRHLKLLSKQQDLKEKLAPLYGCQIYTELFMIANYEICYHGLSHGLYIYYAFVVFGIGTVFLVTSFFKSEMMTKLKIDTKMHKATGFGERYHNFQLKPLAGYIENDRNMYRKLAHIDQKMQVLLYKRFQI